jgi:hypothetical protein
MTGNVIQPRTEPILVDKGLTCERPTEGNVWQPATCSRRMTHNMLRNYMAVACRACVAMCLADQTRRAADSREADRQG